jgi:hypothetical protein
MFDKILIANRGDQSPVGGAAAQPHRMAHKASKCDFAKKALKVLLYV